MLYTVYINRAISYRQEKIYQNSSFFFQRYFCSDILKSTAITIDINERDSGIKILMKIANLSKKCFQSFMESLLELIELMSESPDDKNRIAFIIRQICEIRGEEVYSSIAELLLSKKSKSTIRLMNILLATAPQLYYVRVSLKDDEESAIQHNNAKKTHLFEKLWNAWIFCPVSSICLALISGRYNLAYKTLKFISTQNIIEEDLVEFDRLIQLIESPGFTPLRFELLERPPVLTGEHFYIDCQYRAEYGFTRYIPIYVEVISRLRVILRNEPEA